MNSLEAAVRVTEAVIGKMSNANLDIFLQHVGTGETSRKEFEKLGADIGQLFQAIHGAILKSPEGSNS